LVIDLHELPANFCIEGEGGFVAGYLLIPIENVFFKGALLSTALLDLPCVFLSRHYNINHQDCSTRQSIVFIELEMRMEEGYLTSAVSYRIYTDVFEFEEQTGGDRPSNPPQGPQSSKNTA
jgi:hypothetical protein